MSDKVERTDATPATAGKNELFEQDDPGLRAKLDKKPLIIADDFIVHVVRFDSYDEFLRIPSVVRHVTHPAFLGFAVRAENRKSVKAFYQGGLVLPVGLAKNTIGLEQMPTEKEFNTRAQASARENIKES